MAQPELQPLIALCAPDKFRGTLSAAEAARALAAGARRASWEARELPLADGGEGTLDALGGANRTTVVDGPLGKPVEAGWRLADGLAVIEAARASGLALLSRNEPLHASTRGTGELIAAALAAGAERIVVGVGGTATTDGGLGAVDVLGEPFRVPVLVACDVRTPFLDAARVFGPQKGASRDDVLALSERLERLAARYRDERGVDVTALPGAGAAGGLAGGLGALGAQLVPGFDLVATEAGLDAALDGADLVLTGEGRLDATSFDGKVVGGVLDRCAARGLTAIAVVGEIETTPVPAVSLVDRFGRERAYADAAGCLTEAAAEAIGRPAATRP